MKNVNVKTILAIIMGSTIFFLLSRFLSITVFENTTFTFQYAALGFFAVVFGPIAGLFIGLIGHALSDLSYGAGLWWSWIIVSPLIGFASGFLLKNIHVTKGEFGRSGFTHFAAGSILIHLVGWGLIAPALDIILYGESIHIVFAQGLIASVSNMTTTVIVGSLLLFALAKLAQAKKQ